MSYEEFCRTFHYDPSNPYAQDLYIDFLNWEDGE